MRLCLLRLSALGDVVNLLPLVHAIRQHHPAAELSWVIGAAEAKLLEGLPGVRFIVHAKKSGFGGLRRALAGERFDLLLHAQLSFRATLLGLAIRAERRIGYPRERSKEGHGLVVRERAALPAGRHVVDQWLAFLAPLGIDPAQVIPHWPLPIPEAAHDFARTMLPDADWALISPCSSHPQRNWSAERYATVVDGLHARGLRVALIGGRSELEARTGTAVASAAQAPVLNLIGRDTLKQSLALIARARLLISPDSGPAHFGSALGVPVVGLYAATDPERSGPYRSRHLCANRYADAARQFLGRDAHQLPWGRKIEQPGVMGLIDVAEVLEKVDAALAGPARLG
ncbi:MAG: glycosyltransferase family 9 protein [Xanthomonadales bacterium]|jgi:heptosyltransferase I|nr:glycosyltransferase family 9 protein [Xanthomonadales bacterium]